MHMFSAIRTPSNVGIEHVPQKIIALHRLKSSDNFVRHYMVPFSSVIKVPRVGTKVQPSLFPDFELTKAELEHLKAVTAKNLFVRPCPHIPNHGMKVGGHESVMIPQSKVEDHLRKVWNDIAEGDGVLVMPYNEGQLSAVSHDDIFITGYNNDGVTAGTSPTIVFPLSSYTRKEFAMACTASGEDPKLSELEWVRENVFEPFRLVQIRRSSQLKTSMGAPVNPNDTRGFVPSGILEVKKHHFVLDLNDLEFIKPEEGLLVAQVGGSMLSHASSHCRAQGIAFTIVGTVDQAKNLYPIGTSISEVNGWVGDSARGVSAWNPMSDELMTQAKRGFEMGWGRGSSGDLIICGSFYHEWLSGKLHNDPHVVAFTAGVFMGAITYSAVKACIGEMRHFPSKLQDKTAALAGYNAISSFFNNGDKWDFGPVAEKWCLKWDDKNPYILLSHQGQSRNAVYTRLDKMDLSLQEAFNLLVNSVIAFESGSWSSGFGGKKWADCASKARDAIRAILEDDWKKAITAINILENCVHNGGSLFNKFVGSDVMDASTSGHTLDSLMRAWPVMLLNYPNHPGAEKIRQTLSSHQKKSYDFSMSSDVLSLRSNRAMSFEGALDQTKLILRNVFKIETGSKPFLMPIPGHDYGTKHMKMDVIEDDDEDDNEEEDCDESGEFNLESEMKEYVEITGKKLKKAQNSNSESQPTPLIYSDYVSKISKFNLETQVKK